MKTRIDYGQLVEELKAAGVPISPAQFRECLSRWTGNGRRAAKARAKHPQGKASPQQKGTGEPPSAAKQVAGSASASGNAQTGWKFPNR